MRYHTTSSGRFPSARPGCMPVTFGGLPLLASGTACPGQPASGGRDPRCSSLLYHVCGKKSVKKLNTTKMFTNLQLFLTERGTGERAHPALTVTMVQITGQFKRHGVNRPSSPRVSIRVDKQHSLPNANSNLLNR